MATDLKQQRRLKFQGVFEKLRDELVDYLKAERMPAEAVEWYRRVSRLSYSCVRCSHKAEPRF